MFGLNIFKKKAPLQVERMTAQLNARLQPMNRGDYFEDPLLETMENLQIGEVTGGGTQLSDEPVGIEYCDVEISAINKDQETLDIIINRLEELGAPKGSKLILHPSNKQIPFGKWEGMGIFLNAEESVEETEDDLVYFIEECNKRLKGIGEYRDYWNGQKETSLYFYGLNYQQMYAAIKPFLESHPIYASARFEQIA